MALSMATWRVQLFALSRRTILGQQDLFNRFFSPSAGNGKSNSPAEADLYLVSCKDLKRAIFLGSWYTTLKLKAARRAKRQMKWIKTEIENKGDLGQNPYKKLKDYEIARELAKIMDGLGLQESDIKELERVKQQRNVLAHPEIGAQNTSLMMQLLRREGPKEAWWM